MWKINKGSDCVTKTFRIPVELCDTMQKLATENKISLNALIIQSLNYAIANLELDSCHKK